MRAEFEYEIPVDDANEMLDGLCRGRLVEKTRYRIEHHDQVWEVDEFHGDNEGLALAEVELEDAAQEIDVPDWVGEEVTDDPRFFNAYLAENPYALWDDAI